MVKASRQPEMLKDKRPTAISKPKSKMLELDIKPHETPFMPYPTVAQQQLNELTLQRSLRYSTAVMFEPNRRSNTPIYISNKAPLAITNTNNTEKVTTQTKQIAGASPEFEID